MKKILFIISFTAILFAACGNSDEEQNNVSNTSKTPQTGGLRLNTAIIEGLQVPPCDDLLAELTQNYPHLTEAEIYRAAFEMLSGNKRPEEANACCDKLSDEEARKECKK